MTRSKGFFFIEIIYAFCLLSLMVTVCLNQYAQVSRVLQECVVKRTALSVAQNEIETMRLTAIPIADYKKVGDLTVHRTASIERITQKHDIYRIHISVKQGERELVVLETGALHERS
jgi:Tfp pilus assembly protein PilV